MSEYIQLDERWRQRAYKRQCNNLVRWFEDAVGGLGDNFERASGYAICDLCGLILLEHPQLKNGLFLDCRGNFWHL